MRFCSKFVLLLTLACLGMGQAFASQLPIASFRVETDRDTVEEGMNLPVRVTARDADGEVKTDYIGTVYFVVRGDPDPKIPANKAQGYTFLAGENGVHLFSEGIVFSAPGSTEVITIDLDNENIQGSKMVTVTRNPCKDPSALISILAPKDGTKVSVPTVTINGATRPNCSAILLLNNTKIGDITADTKGSYASTIPGLKEGENTITAQLINGNKSSIRAWYELDRIAITSPADGGAIIAACNPVTGTTTPNKLVTVSVNGKTAGSITSDASGNWTLEKACGFINGNNTVSAINKTGAKAVIQAKFNAGIRILSPADQSTVTDSCQRVTGTTTPGMRVTVTIAGKTAGSGTTDASGNFGIPVCGLVTGTNVITATNEANSRDIVNVKMECSVIVTSPLSGNRTTFSTGTVTGQSCANTPIFVRIGNKDICWGTTDSKGQFSISNCPLPSCDVVLVADSRNAQGKTLASSSSVFLRVLPEGNTCDQARFTCLKGMRSSGNATLDFCVAPENNVKSFRVVSGPSCESLSGAVNTPEKTRIYGPDWKNYRWNVPTTAGPLAVKIIALDASGVATGLPSECLVLDDGQCEIGSITGIHSSADIPHLRSTLTWNNHPDAASYNVYVRPENSNALVFVQNIAQPPYIVHLSQDRVAFADYVVRGVCKTGAKASPDMRNATKVQTGPGAWAVLGIMALLMGAVLLRFVADRAR